SFPERGRRSHGAAQGCCQQARWIAGAGWTTDARTRGTELADQAASYERLGKGTVVTGEGGASTAPLRETNACAKTHRLVVLRLTVAISQLLLQSSLRCLWMHQELQVDPVENPAGRFAGACSEISPAPSG